MSLYDDTSSILPEDDEDDIPPQNSIYTTAISRLKTQRKSEQICCITTGVIWVLALISMAVCLVLTLNVYPGQQNNLENKRESFEYDWAGSSESLCSICSGDIYSCTSPGVYMTKYFNLPSDWNYDLTTMDDVYLTLKWGTFDCTNRSFLTIYSNGVKLHFQELDLSDCNCGQCRQTKRFMESGFHKYGDENRTIWIPHPTQNSISFQVTGGSICVTHTTLDIRYSTALFINYASRLDSLWWAGICLAIFVVMVPLGLFGQAIRICTRSKTGTVSIVQVAEATPSEKKEREAQRRINPPLL